MHLDRLFPKRLRGNVSLTTVILAGALLIVTGMAVLSNAIDVAMTTKSYFNRIAADTRVNSCLEEGMYRLSRYPTYTGTITVTYPDGNCSVVITNQANPSLKDIAITAQFGTFTARRTKHANTTTSPMTISN